MDLQIGGVTGTSGTVSIPMKHKMGLVEIVPSAKSVAATLTRTYNKTDGTYTQTTSGTASVTASNAFTGNKPLTNSSRYFYIVKATGTSTNTAVTFSCETNQTDFWTAVSSGTDTGYGKYKSLPVYSDRTAQTFVATFSCVRTVQQVVIPWYGTYILECWGASGGCFRPATYSSRGGYGGHAKGTIALNRNADIYVCVGGQGSTVDESSTALVNTGFNGGGIPTDVTSQASNTSGGGCTHIARLKGSDSKGQLKGLSGYKDDGDKILMVAGGGGGGDGASGGDGGGPSGTRGNTYSTYTGGYGGTLTGPGAAQNGANKSIAAAGFGYGGYCNDTNVDAGAGGGGGWYGGGCTVTAGGGGGGSGYIASTINQIAHEQSTHTGDGYATITSQ